MDVQKRIKDLEKRVDVLEGKPKIAKQKHLSLTEDRENANSNSKRTVNLRKHGWFYTKSKKSREVAIDEAIKEYGANAVYWKTIIKSQRITPAGIAYEEAKNYVIKNYDIKSQFGMKRKQ
jgi:hypothetical protein